MNKKRTNPIDIHVGQRMRARRMAIDMSQTDLGNAMGVTFQQIQKYEKGANRLSGSRMHQAAVALGVIESHFFDGLPPVKEGAAHSVPDFGTQFLATSEGTDLAKVWHRIPVKVRRQFVHLAQEMAA